MPFLRLKLALIICLTSAASSVTPNAAAVACSSTIPVVSGAISLRASAARTSGVGPLAVFFDATPTTSSTGGAKPFHDIEYQWDFGDALSGTWTNTPNMPNLSRNLATGPVASHVFETPSGLPYTVTVTAKDGTSTVSCSIPITVTDPNTVFSGADTICVSSVGLPVAGSGGCPSGATVANQANFVTAIGLIAGTKKRLLFKRGDTFAAPGIAVLNLTGPGIIGAYGLAGAAPVINTTGMPGGGGNILQLASGGSTIGDWRLMDLDFAGLNKAGVVAVSTDGAVSQVTHLRIKAHDMSDGVQFSIGVLDCYNGGPCGGFPFKLPVYDQIALVDSTITHMLAGYGAFMTSTRLSILGNLIDDTSVGEHCTRVTFTQKAMISNNTFSRAAPSKHALTVRSPQHFVNGPTLPALTDTQFVVISDNKFVGSAGVDFTVTLESPNVATDNRMGNIIVERNWFVTGSGTGTQVGLKTEAYELTVRNNIFDTTGGLGHIGVSIQQPSIAPVPDQVRVYNNTIYSGDTTGGSFIGVDTQNSPTNVSIKNNLGWAPNHSGLATSNLNEQPIGPGFSLLNNSTDPQIKSTPPNFASATPVNPVDFKLVGPVSTYPRDTGTVIPVFSDFFRINRPAGAAIDIGATER